MLVSAGTGNSTSPVPIHKCLEESMPNTWSFHSSTVALNKTVTINQVPNVNIDWGLPTVCCVPVPLGMAFTKVCAVANRSVAKSDFLIMFFEFWSEKVALKRRENK